MTYIPSGSGGGSSDGSVTIPPEMVDDILDAADQAFESAENAKDSAEAAQDALTKMEDIVSDSYTKDETDNLLDTKVSQDSQTGAAELPSGTSAERPSSAKDGFLRYNTDTKKFEGHQDGAWEDLPTGTSVGSSETAATIKTKYESNADTNAYTDADKTAVDNLGELSEVDFPPKDGKIYGIQDETLVEITAAGTSST